MAYDLEEVRKRLKQSLKKTSDPDEFRPEKAKDKPINYKFFILPPLMQGEQCLTGTASKSMDQFFLSTGAHWVRSKPYGCPRLVDDSAFCPLCNFGFDLMKEETDKETRSQIAKQWMPNTGYMVNIYFPDQDINPPDLRDKVKYFKAPKTVMDIWEECLQRDSAGPSDDPKAFGIFFDENRGFYFQLNAEKQNDYNNYKRSNFVPNGGQPAPIRKNADGTPDKTAITNILARRIDLYTKLEVSDKATLDRLMNLMINGGPEDEQAHSQPAQQATPKTTTSSAPVQTAPPQSAPAQAARTTTAPAVAESVTATATATVPPAADNSTEEAEINELLSRLD